MFLGLLGGVLDERDNRQQNRQRRQAPVFRARQYFELEDFHKRFRLTREQVEDLMQNIGPQIEARSLRASALSVQDKVLTTLRYFASGAIYTVIADANGPLLPQLSFYNVNQPNGMPMACGCVDGTLINIIAPSEAEFQYVDRKSDHSINAIKTRRVIECAYGVFKNSFLCLKRLRHEDPVFCCEEAMNNMGFEMEADEGDDDGDNDVAPGRVDDDGNNVPQTQAAAQASAHKRLQTMVNTFRH